MANKKTVPLSQAQILRFAIKHISREIDLCNMDIRDGKRTEVEMSFLLETIKTLRTLYRIETGRDYTPR